MCQPMCRNVGPTEVVKCLIEMRRDITIYVMVESCVKQMVEESVERPVNHVSDA